MRLENYCALFFLLRYSKLKSTVSPNLVFNDCELIHMSSFESLDGVYFRVTRVFASVRSKLDSPMDMINILVCIANA